MSRMIRELIERRTANSKHWLRDDGLTEVEIYIKPIHYEDEHGRWQDIETDIEDRAEVVDGEGYGLRAVKAPFRAHFGRSAKSPQRFEVPGKGHIIIRPLGVGASHAQVERSKATYRDAWKGVDWVRTILPEGIKSDFILKDRSAPNEFRFRVHAGGLDYRQLPDGTVEWIKARQRVAAFRAPVVRDAAGAEGPVYQWIEPGAAGLELAIQVDQAWLEDPARAFPVTIDPVTVTLQPDSTAGKDTQLSSHLPDNNWGTYPSLGVGLSSDGTELYRSLVQFDLSSIPSGSVINSATLSLYCDEEASSTDDNVWVHRATASWSESTATWNNQPSHEATASAVTTITGLGWFSWDIKSLVQGWVNGSFPNYGMKLIGEETDTGSWKIFYSSDVGVYPTLRPKLTITYNRYPVASSPTPGGASTTPTRLNTTTPRLSWTYSDPDNDVQAAYQVIITRDSDSVIVKDTGEVASSNAYYDVPGGTLAEGVKYRWKVRVKDSGGLWSAYTSEVYIYTNRAPSASPTSPLGTSASPAIIANSTTPRLQWSFSDPDGDAQAKYRAIVKRASDSLTIRDTGWVASANQYYDVPAGDLSYGVTYYWQVQVEDPYGRQSALTTAQYFTPNQTPNAPTNLSPAGASTDPAEVNTLTPALTWTHSDPNNDPQKSFQVLIYRASDNVLVHDSGEVVSGTSSYPVPAGVLSGSVKYYWRVRTKDTGSQLFGPYSADAYIYTNRPPYAPTNLSPASGAVFDATTVKRFSWTFQDPDITPNGDAQSAFQVLIYRASDGALVHDSGKVVSGNQYYDLPANTLVNGVDYQWQVRTWDLQDQAGPYSSLVGFRTGRPPAVSITSPADAGSYGKGILTVQWSYSDPDTDPQVQYQAVLKTGAGVVIEDSGIIASGDTQHRFTTVLSNYSQYQVTVTVWDATGQSATDTNIFTTDFVPPTAPILGLVTDDNGAKIILAITNPDDDPAKPITDRNDLYRRRQGDTSWTRIAKGLPVNGGYDDYATASGATYEYKVVAISVDETTAESAVVSGGIAFSGVWLHDPRSPAATACHFLYDGQAREETWEPVVEFLEFAGRDRPVAEFGEQTDERVRVTLQLLRDGGDLEALRALVRRRAVLCYRDGRGRKLFGVVAVLPVSDQQYGAEVVVEIMAVAYSEAV